MIYEQNDRIDNKVVAVRSPDIVVGIGDIYTGGETSSIIVTYSLGSCIGVSIYDSVSRTGGLAHFMLPMSRDNPLKAADKPGLYCDTGMAQMLQRLYESGAEKKRLIIKLAGGARVLDINDTFRIGSKNNAVIRKFLWKNGLMIAADDTGGEVARTMYLDMGTGRTFLRKQGKIHEL